MLCCTPLLPTECPPQHDTANLNLLAPQGIKYNGERVGVALDPLPEGPYFKGVAKGGFGADSSSAATLMDKKK